MLLWKHHIFGGVRVIFWTGDRHVLDLSELDRKDIVDERCGTFERFFDRGKVPEKSEILFEKLIWEDDWLALELLAEDKSLMVARQHRDESQSLPLWSPMDQLNLVLHPHWHHRWKNWPHLQSTEVLRQVNFKSVTKKVFLNLLGSTDVNS